MRDWIVDFHCDTLCEMMRHGGHLRQRSGHLDIERLAAAGGDLQMFAVWSNPSSVLGALHDALVMTELFWQAVDENLISPVLWREDLEGKLPGVAGLLSIEGAEPFGRDPRLLRHFFRLGVRAVGLTWNSRNALADGIDEDASGGGLTQVGRKMIAEMNELGMLVDVSHLSEAGFWDVAEVCRGPFIASHSNAKAICSHRRNLSNEQLRAIAASGGMVGINLCPSFLADTQKATVTDILRHIGHMLSVMGRGHIGLGCDFDGIGELPEGISGVESLPLIAEAVEKEFGSAVAAEIMGNDFVELLVKVLPERLTGHTTPDVS